MCRGLAMTGLELDTRKDRGEFKTYVKRQGEMAKQAVLELSGDVSVRFESQVAKPINVG